jgi:hypothetical protein
MIVITISTLTIKPTLSNRNQESISQLIKVMFGSKNVTQMVMVMVSARLLVVTNLNRLVSNFSVISDYGWTKTNMI